MNRGNDGRRDVRTVLEEAATSARRVLIVHEASTHARISAAVVGRALTKMGLKPQYFGDSQATGSTKRFWTTTIKDLPAQDCDLVALCCITWPDWYAEEQTRAQEDLARLAQKHGCVIALTGRWPDGYSRVPDIYELLVPQDIESTFGSVLDGDDRRLLELVLCDRRQIEKSRMPDAFRLVDILGARLTEELTVEALASAPGMSLAAAAAQTGKTPNERLADEVRVIAVEQGAWLTVEFPNDLDRHGTKVLYSVLSQRAAVAPTFAIGVWHDQGRTRFYLVRESGGDLPSVEYLLSDIGDQYAIGKKSLQESNGRWSGPQDAQSVTIRGAMSTEEQSRILRGLQKFCEDAVKRQYGHRTPPIAVVRAFTTAGNTILREMDLKARHTGALKLAPERCFVLSNEGNRSGQVRKTLVLTILVRSGDAGAFLFGGAGYNLNKLEDQLQGLLVGMKEQPAMRYGLEGVSRIRIDTCFTEEAASTFPSSMRTLPDVIALNLNEAIEGGLVHAESKLALAIAPTDGRIVLYMGSETIGPSVQYAMAVRELCTELDEVRSRPGGAASNRPIRVLDIFAGSGQTVRFLSQLTRRPHIVAIDLNISAADAGLQDSEHLVWLQVDVLGALAGPQPMLSTTFDVVCMDPPHSALFGLLIREGRAEQPPALLNRKLLGAEWLVLYQGHVTQAGRTSVVTTALEPHFEIIEMWRVGPEVLVVAGPKTWAGGSGEEILKRVRQRLDNAARPFKWSVDRARVETSASSDFGV